MKSKIQARPSLLFSKNENFLKNMTAKAGEYILLLIASLSVFAVLFIFYFILRDAIPFISDLGLTTVFKSSSWYPTGNPPAYGALSIFYGSLMVTIGACVVAIPLGVSAAIALSDILPFSWRQFFKPIIELLASIPSVAYGFFALVVFAPLLQEHGGSLIQGGIWLVGFPIAAIASVVVGISLAEKLNSNGKEYFFSGIIFACFIILLYFLTNYTGSIVISSGTNAFNVSIILGIMALPTIVSVAEDALQAAGTELREGSYGLGATRAETLIKVILPAASSGICAGVILGIMRALGETMVVWMAAGNAAKIPEPFYNFFSPVRTLTATIAGEMGETARGTNHYSVLFLLASCLLIFSFICNMLSEWVMKRNREKLRGER